jgi:energy-coupling factor transport system ATP-binding protein
VIRFNEFSYDYPDASVPTLAPTTLIVPRGAFALVVGPSGSGKSTLLRAVNGLVPNFTGGRVGGSAVVAGRDPVAAGPAAMSRHVGFVSGDPETAFVTDTVEDEVAFALEHQGIPRSTMHNRVGDALRQVGLEGLADRSLATLSGGERQRVAVAGALALQPEILVLDEPTSQLDDHAAAAVLSAMVSLARSSDLTVFMSEHRIERVAPHVDQVIYLRQQGAAPLSVEPSEILPDLRPPDENAWPGSAPLD